MAAIDAAVEQAKVDLPDQLVADRAAERWGRVERQLAARGMAPDSYLQMHGKTREEIIEESMPDAAQELPREAVLVAVVDAEGIEVTDEELLEALAHPAEHERTTPEKLLERLRENGRDAMIAADIRVRKAIDVVAEGAKAIPPSRPRRGRRSGRPRRSARRRDRSGPRVQIERARPPSPSIECRHEPTGPDGRRADLARRALVRHLLAPAQRADRLPGHADDDDIANLVVAQLLHLESEDPDKDISLYVNSPGGSVYAGLAIYDTMQFIKPDVQTICVGIAMSMGALLLAGGRRRQADGAAEREDPDPPGVGRLRRPGDRHRDPRPRDHRRPPPPRRDPRQAHRPAVEKVTNDTDRDYFMSAEEAKEYGLVDRVIEHH